LASSSASAPEQPTLQVTTVDGATFDLSQHRGKYVVVNFWATWCAPCLKEIPDFSALVREREDVVVIGLAYEEISVEDMKRFLQRIRPAYPIAIVDVAAPPADFAKPRGLPMTYLLGPDGRVLEKYLGPVTRKELLTRIARARDA
jgi:thiol-disulfide isomerase/thioredoxin